MVFGKLFVLKYNKDQFLQDNTGIRNFGKRNTIWRAKKKTIINCLGFFSHLFVLLDELLSID
jgi:hypothetical protein